MFDDLGSIRFLSLLIKNLVDLRESAFAEYFFYFVFAEEVSINEHLA